MNAVAAQKPKLPSFVNLILVIILGVSLAKLMWLVLSPAKEVDTSFSSAGEVTNINSKSVDYGKQIANQHIFGVIKKKPVVKQAKAPPKPVKKAVVRTKLNLKLHGIVAYKSKSGLALISKDNGSQKVFGKGEKIQEGVTITNILPEKVILDNNGQVEELILPKKKVSKNSKSKRGALTQHNLPGSQPVRKSAKASMLGQKQPSVNLGSFRQKVVKNPAILMQVARPTPTIVDGKFIGFRVQPGTDRKMFRKLGFRANDIIIEVNGIVLDDASKGAMVYEELKQAADVSITVQRGAEQIIINRSF
ncbi:MAG: type II secretion system protein GspC [Cocleimonas sp.]